MQGQGSSEDDDPLYQSIPARTDSRRSITYKLKGKKQIFGIDADTGMIYAKGLLSVGSYALKVKKYIFILRNTTFTLLYTNALAQQILVYIKFK